MVAALLAGRKTQTRRLATSPLARCELGDRLYVREAFQTGSTTDGPQLSYAATPDFFPIDAWDWPDEGAGASFNYDRCPGAQFHHWLSDVLSNNGPWRPSIHMPRWASRLTLHVEGVKIEPVQSISDEDAWSEGVCQAVETGGRAAFGETCSPEMRRMIVETIYGSGARAFNWLWDSLHTKTGETWSDNPLIIALTFRVERGNIDQVARAA